ncbi:MAG: glycine--tRNA ligase subunit beta [Magnetococcales bacterium]|nr:glycine--tRNA ligase subunit beta [Magnetococcales bacterium]
MEFLWEIGCEEIPAGMLAAGIRYFADAMEKQLTEAGLFVGGSTRIASHGTPRRLVVMVTHMATQQADRVEEMRGPPVDRAFDAQGNPSKAAAGFAKSCGVSVGELQRIDTPKGAYLCHTIHRPGLTAESLLPELMKGILEGFPWPKTQRWGSGKTRFVRPINWMLALMNGRVLPFATSDGLHTGQSTQGHRFMARGPFGVSSIADYHQAMASGHVILDMERRKQIIREGIERLANTVGGQAVIPDELLQENANLTEWPIPLLGHYSPDYLKIPPEVLTTSMKNHQKYFPILDSHGSLMPCFIAISNNDVPDHTLVKRGYERVLRARLEDAAFYWDEDRKEPLINRLESLKNVVFQAKLGTLYDKTVRMEQLVTRLAAIAGSRVNSDQVLTATRLCKCDLVTGMVGQFPELQGIMGGYYARHAGADPAIVQAIREHYRPMGAADSVPESLEGRLVSLADKLDTLAGCFGIGLVPTGTKDPFALRRAALGIIRMLLDDGGVRFHWVTLMESAYDAFAPGVLTNNRQQTVDNLTAFFDGRLQNHLKTSGFDYDLIEAVQTLGLDDCYDIRERIVALNQFRTMESYGALVAANKRIANILSKATENWQHHPLDPAQFTEPAEGELLGHLVEVEQQVDAAIQHGNYAHALGHLAGLRAGIDTFFDQIMVMDPDMGKRLNRLALLARVRGAFYKVADISRLSAP